MTSDLSLFSRHFVAGLLLPDSFCLCFHMPRASNGLAILNLTSGRGTAGRCTGPKWSKMVKTTMLLEDPNLLKLMSLDSSCPFFLSENSIWGR